MSTPFWDVSKLVSPWAVPEDFDDEGFLRRPGQWQPELAESIALALGLSLNPDHHQILAACRDFYTRYQRMPTTRAFINHLAITLGEDWRSSARLMQHFPNTPMRWVAICAGLPKPPNCF